ncbi:peptidoglycan DD-metalloendopeptidase family protein [Pseudoduganella sp.]|uniref:peptidoglycan DD-metalloendopeptidase family protein n=1 Tax=Pseudoduganella sp. TaxID=1880898 RepID=UPI0035B39CC1
MFPLVFLQACLASVLAGAGAWLLLRLAARTWPALQARRAPWLLAVAAVAASLALGLLPASWRPAIVPVLELPAATVSGADPRAPSLAAHGGNHTASGGDDATDDGATPLAPAPALLWLGYAWLAIYAAGLAAAGARWLQARRHLDALLAAARRLDRYELAAHPGFANLHRALPEVREIDAPIAPMLAGLLRPVLLLPRHLRAFDPAQQRLVVEHELTHLARRDHLWMHLSFLLQAVQWFNPMVARLGKQMAWAQELGCDRTVLEGRPAAQRRAYAAALVTQMRMQAVPDQATALAFGGRVVDAVAARIGMIRDGVPAMPRAAALGWAALPAMLLASVLLQPALAWRLDGAPGAVAAAANAAGSASADGATPAGAAGAQPWQAPMQRLRVSAFFGIRHAPTGRPHGGMDFAAPRGTPIVAPADGVVLTSTNSYMGEAKWGEVIVIEHANGLRSLYAHLEQRQLREGARVAAGQQIGTSGASGKVTGPHLHLEISRHGENIDPQQLLGNLEANATKTALQRLKASRSS